MSLLSALSKTSTVKIEQVRNSTNSLYWFKATNGCGKSTLMHYMLENSSEEEIEYIKKEKKTLFTIFKKYKFISIGPYIRGKTFGGCDSLEKSDILLALEILKEDKYTEYDILVEGILTGAGTLGTGKPKTGKSYYDTIKEFPRKNKYYLFIDVSWENVLKRIQARTGKSDEELDSLKNVQDKYEACKKHEKTYLELNDISVKHVSNNSTREDFVKLLLKEL